MQSYFSKFEEQWFSYCNEELEKINTFFAGTFQFSATAEVSHILPEAKAFLFMGNVIKQKSFRQLSFLVQT